MRQQGAGAGPSTANKNTRGWGCWVISVCFKILQLQYKHTYFHVEKLKPGSILDANKVSGRSLKLHLHTESLVVGGPVGRVGVVVVQSCSQHATRGL
jgi:hypothetical protein